MPGCFAIWTLFSSMCLADPNRQSGNWTQTLHGSRLRLLLPSRQPPCKLRRPGLRMRSRWQRSSWQMMYYSSSWLKWLSLCQLCSGKAHNHSINRPTHLSGAVKARPERLASAILRHLQYLLSATCVIICFHTKFEELLVLDKSLHFLTSMFLETCCRCEYPR